MQRRAMPGVAVFQAQTHPFVHCLGQKSRCRWLLLGVYWALVACRKILILVNLR
jgi:hypothetical protein